MVKRTKPKPVLKYQKTANYKKYITLDAKMMNKIFSRLAGGEAISHICQGDEMPTRAAFWKWIAKGYIPEDEITPKNKKYYDFRLRYLSFKESQAEHAYSKIEKIEEQMLKKEIDTKIGLAAIKSMQWRISRMDPRRYAPRVPTVKVEVPPQPSQIDHVHTIGTAIADPRVDRLNERLQPKIVHALEITPSAAGNEGKKEVAV